MKSVQLDVEIEVPRHGLRKGLTRLLKQPLKSSPRLGIDKVNTVMASQTWPISHLYRRVWSSTPSSDRNRCGQTGVSLLAESLAKELAPVRVNNNQLAKLNLRVCHSQVSPLYDNINLEPSEHLLRNRTTVKQGYKADQVFQTDLYHEPSGCS